MELWLNGKWMFRQTSGEKWMDAKVPGCNYLDLMNNGVIPDPFVGCNEEKVRWVAESDWEYKKDVFVSNQLLEKAKRAFLVCDMLDTVCEIFVNDFSVGKKTDCFIPFRKNIKPFLRCGYNEIRIVFYSPIKYIENKYERDKAPKNSYGLAVCHIRKPQCHFGWDWGPMLPPSGISGNIHIDFMESSYIRSLKIEQSHADNKVRVFAASHIEHLGKRGKKCRCVTSLIAPDGEIITQNTGNAVFEIENPQLWWTRDLSEKARQPLYTVRSQLINEHGTVIDEKEKRIGLRKIELRREPDEYGESFRFYLNDVPLFIKGASYIPADSFITRFDSYHLIFLMQAVEYSNMNMIRIWGGGYYGSDKFYNECDKRGILIWQDLPFACTAYPFFKKDFREDVEREIRCNVTRLSHHPSLALWCGNNEIEDMQLGWIHMKNYVESNRDFFYNNAPEIIRASDKTTPYIPGSPTGVGYNNGVQSDNAGDTHLWAVWHGLQPYNYYRKRMTRFCSEFGFESLPDLKTLRSFAHGSELSLSSDVMKSHQKCDGGNDKMLYYMASRFRLPKRFRDYVYLSQLTQEECIADAVENWRRNRGRCDGAIYWQLNDCWSVASWSSYDYFGNYKALQYKARLFNAPLSVSVDDTDKDRIRLYVLNDTMKSRTVTVKYELFDFESGTLISREKELYAASLGKSLAFELDKKSIKNKYDLKRTGLCVTLYEDGKEVMYKTHLFDMEKNLDLPKAKLRCVITIKDNFLEMNVTTDNYARFVRLESSNCVVPLSDNFFDLLPGRSRTVTMIRTVSVTPREQAEGISVYSLCDIQTSDTPIADSIKSKKVFLSPKSIANAVFQSRPPKDAKLTE